MEERKEELDEGNYEDIDRDEEAEAQAEKMKVIERIMKRFNDKKEKERLEKEERLKPYELSQEERKKLDKKKTDLKVRRSALGYKSLQEFFYKANQRAKKEDKAEQAEEREAMEKEEPKMIRKDIERNMALKGIEKKIGGDPINLVKDFTGDIRDEDKKQIKKEREREKKDKKKSKKTEFLRKQDERREVRQTRRAVREDTEREKNINDRRLLKPQLEAKLDEKVGEDAMKNIREFAEFDKLVTKRSEPSEEGKEESMKGMKGKKYDIERDTEVFDNDYIKLTQEILRVIDTDPYIGYTEGRRNSDEKKAQLFLEDFGRSRFESKGRLGRYIGRVADKIFEDKYERITEKDPNFIRLSKREKENAFNQFYRELYEDIRDILDYLGGGDRTREIYRGRTKRLVREAYKRNGDTFVPDYEELESSESEPDYEDY